MQDVEITLIGRPATKECVGFSWISELLTQVLSHYEFREKRVSGVYALLMGVNEFISVLCIFLTDLGEIRYYKLQN